MFSNNFTHRLKIVILIILSSVKAYSQEANKSFSIGIFPCAIIQQSNFTDINGEGWMAGEPPNLRFMWSGGINAGNPDKIFASAYFVTCRTSNEGTFSGYSVSASFYQFSYGISIHYAICDIGHLKLFAAAGINYSTINILSKSKDGMPIGDTITLFENTTINQNLHINAEVSISIPVFKANQDHSLIPLELKMGYDFLASQPTNYNWYSYGGGNTKTISKPSINLSGFYAGIGINVWLWGKNGIFSKSQ